MDNKDAFERFLMQTKICTRPLKKEIAQQLNNNGTKSMLTHRLPMLIGISSSILYSETAYILRFRHEVLKDDFDRCLQREEYPMIFLGKTTTSGSKFALNQYENRINFSVIRAFILGVYV